MGMSEAELKAMGLPSMPSVGQVSPRQPLGPPQGYYQDFTKHEDPVLARDVDVLLRKLRG